MYGSQQPVRVLDHRRRASGWRALPACALLILCQPVAVSAQTLTPDMLNPAQGGFAPRDQSLLRRTAQATTDDDGLRRNAPAPSRIGVTPTYGTSPASGASDSGFDSLNRTRKKPKLYPGAPKPKVVGPGNPPPAPPRAKVAAPVSASVAGTFPGQPPRRRLKPDDDPFANVGFHTGTFLTKAAVELWGGYNSNPGRMTSPKGSAFYTVAPELLVASDWERHSLIADLRGSFTGYSTTFPVPPGTVGPVPTNIDAPTFNGRIAGRIDAARDTRINTELRMRVFTDNPGSPNIQAGLSKYPLATTVGGTAGIEHDFNRLQVSVAGLADRTTYQESKLTDGSTFNNDDRNFNQFGGLARVSYDLMPGLKPFGEAQGDTRLHDVKADRFGYQRDSNGGYVKAGTTFEFSRLLTGEAAIGYSMRTYQDSRLTDMKGLLTSASLIWTASGLTTVTLAATSSIDETTLPGVSGVISRDYSLQVDHAFRRWLIGTAKVGTGTSDYDGTRFDRRYFVEGDLVYKLSRTFQLKAQVRHDWLDSSVNGASSAATIVMLGIRVQR
ncbi:MAG: outer membrane beta-barrel protein [Afipia sp.]|nr:outer membrane beta-barrel protein [Afipia sp.]